MSLSTQQQQQQQEQPLLSISRNDLNQSHHTQSETTILELQSSSTSTQSESDSHSPLPSTSSTSISQSNQSNLLPPWLIIIIWISISSSVIFYNALILKEWSFPYPITLTALHLAFQTIATQTIARTTNWINSSTSSSKPNSNSNQINENQSEDHVLGNRSLPFIEPELYWKKVVPIGILFSISLVLSNAVYLYLSVAFIQMIKAASPVAVLLTSFAFGIYPPSLRLFGIVLIISLGIGIASYGEVAFSLIGFLIQVVAIVVEANRVVLIQMLLGTGMSPLTSLYFFAPVCLIINSVLILPLEGFDSIKAIPKLGVWVILSNASLTFLLNISSVYLIQLSSLILSLSKVLKDLILIFFSSIFMNHQINLLQSIGYLISLVGLIAYKKGI
ncbi:uncharacterized protein MELLADRAFT_72742 [Melampsora larici-populina 98AG31]|uniref:Sugar phosphate transporter domain-containing protein n=1 Tax=Melampsora larici-populina (strain 98AG31 / pathotype 3-4-7) TaxID=747676 RepID=F4RY58_MELLP|nr:uncharacterized protein MELLADRAFT_72742 [Melampsora larici-populina 98AG31]EGG02624.1 hypothetical protein MELLADRAFT_72742 [Melampsora larici-populina 98AG31]